VRAAVFTGPDTPVEVTDVELAPPGPGEIRVRIAAAGVCHSDLHVRRGEWQPPAPLVMGHEGSGVVTAVGPGVSGLAEGDHVVLSWVAPCGQCRYCRAGREARCQVAATIVAPGGTMPDGTILGSNYGSVRPAIDIPALVDRYMDGQLKLDEMVSARRPLEAARASLDDLQAGHALRTLLIP
jgi:Zn-dependent alcohol dehydrogenase